jgi:atypical dual specificity phosphatase
MTVRTSPHFDAFSILKTLGLGFISLSGIIFLAFQKKLLSKPLSRIVSKIFFYPTFPFTILQRIGNYWTPIDDTLILGCAPMALFGHPKALFKLGVRGVVNMCDEYSGPVDAYKNLNILQLRLPTGLLFYISTFFFFLI